jgi:hypothetical protein
MNIDFGEWEVEDIVDSRVRDGRVEYLIHWKGFDKSADTWEPEVNLTETCSEILSEYNARKNLLNQNCDTTTKNDYPSISVLTNINSMIASSNQSSKINFRNMFYDEEEEDENSILK